MLRWLLSVPAGSHTITQSVDREANQISKLDMTRQIRHAARAIQHVSVESYIDSAGLVCVTWHGRHVCPVTLSVMAANWLWQRIACMTLCVQYSHVCHPINLGCPQARQRACLARAYIDPPPPCILEAPTSVKQPSKSHHWTLSATCNSMAKCAWGVFPSQHFQSNNISFSRTNVRHLAQSELFYMQEYLSFLAKVHFQT